jgi:DNA-binding LytR/AlgR family response regulator
MQQPIREPMPDAVHAAPSASPLRQRLVRGLIIGAVAALALAIVGALHTDAVGFPLRLAYWLAVVLPGSILGLVVQSAVSAWGGIAGRRWLEMLVVAVMIAVPHTFVVIVASMLMFGIGALTPATVIAFGGIVLMFSLILTTINYLSGAVASPVLPVAILPVAALSSTFPVSTAPEAAFVPLVRDTIPSGLAERLPPRLGTGRLIALEAEDHYLRVHTDLGHDIILMRMSDAIALLDALPGARVHRSWWVARHAVEGSSSIGGRTTLCLATGIAAPVSRAMRPSLAAQGWFL